MFGPLRNLLNLGGVLPQGFESDRYVANAVMVAKLYYLCLYIYRKQKDYRNLLELWFSISDVGLDCISGMMIVRNIFVSRHSFISLVRKCSMSEDSFGKKSVRIFEVSTFFIFCILLVLRIYLRSKASGQFTALHDTIMALNYIPSMEFLLLAHQLGCKFSALNEDMRVVAEAVKYRSLPTSHLLSELTLVYRKHLHLKDLRRQIDSFFGLFNAIVISSRVVYLTIAFYDQITIVCDPAADLKYIDVVVLLTASSFLLLTCDVCYRCSEKAKETVRISHAIVDQNTPPQIIDQIEEFSFTMFNNHATIFSAAGLFNLNRELITKITLATVTCLIIAIQITNFDANKPNISVANITDSPTEVMFQLVTIQA